MGMLLVVFLIYVTQSFAIGHQGAIKKTDLRITYPKKSIPIMHRYLNIVNRRFVKTPEEKSTKKYNSDIYEAFPSIPANHKNIPESPYFPLASNIEHRPRVKKMLPDYGLLLRRKRSATEAVKPKTDVKPAASKDDNINRRKLTDKAPSKAKAAKNISKKKKSSKVSQSHVKSSRKPKHSTVKDKQKVNKAKANKKKSRQHRHQSNSARREKVESRRLIAGREASIEDYPYVVSIQKSGEHWCSGALLNQRLVITTANCVWKSTQTSKMQVRACSRYVNQGGQEARIQEVRKHPGWSLRKSPDNDVALLSLDRNIKFSHACHAVDLPNLQMLPVFDDAWITSWGAERRDGIYERPGMTLQVYHARLLDRDKCNNITQRFGVTVSQNFICLAQSGRRAPCTRDTGAPAVSDGVLWGLASWGIRKLCGTERFPAMFSFLASHSNVKFISLAMNQLMADERLYPFWDRYVHPAVVTTTPSEIGIET